MTATIDRILTPGSPEHLSLVTASKVAAIMGLSPWASPLSTWQQMKGLDPGTAQTREQSRGHYLEPAVMEWWQDQHPEYTDVAEQVVLSRGELPWAAATPDGIATGAGVPIVGVEAKTAADTRDAWGKPGTDEIPLYYAIQAMWQMHLGGHKITYFPVLGEYLTFSEYVIEYDPLVGAELERQAFEFWESLLYDDAPPLDDHPATLESLRRVYSDIDKATDVYIGTDLARRYVAAVQAEKAGKAALTAAKSEMAKAMTNARRALVVVGEDALLVATRQAAANGAPYVKAAPKLPTIPSED